MRTSRLFALGVVAALAALTSHAAAQGQPSFTKGTLGGASLSQPTSLQFGPDGRLYVSQQNGLIKIFTVTRTGAGAYSVSATETVNIINDIPNHNDDGSLAPEQFKRMVTGLLVTGTAANPMIYVTSSDPRIAVGEDSGLDTNSGILSRLTWTGSTWTKVDLVRGLPRCEENHASNGMALDAANGYIYIAQGGNTNMGAPANNFGLTPDYALSAAILRVDLDAIGNSTYDIPTLDDPTRPNTGPGGSDENDPFGGNDGANQAKIVAGGPVQVWAPGYRNPYDILITSTGRLYTIDNGPNNGWGGPPISCGNAQNESGSHSYGDQLHYLGMLGDANGGYGGHPVPFRAGATINGLSPIPPGTADPQQCNYLVPGTQDGALHVWSSSTNGLCEYTANNFGGAMQGNLIAATWTGNSIERIILGPSGTTASVQTLFANVGTRQLDVTAQGSGQVFPGTIWSCDHPGGKIYVFEPADSGSCTGANNPALDEDSDGYDNADEIASGSDPCSAGSVPPDNDGDMTGDLTDNDDDNDGIPDTTDAYAIDAANGMSTNMPIDYGWAVGEPGFGLFGLGFTGLMTDGVDYLGHYNVDDLTPGGAAGKFTIDVIDAGDAYASLNTQNNAFQFGVNVSSATGKFVVASGFDAPYFDERTPVGNESGGIYIGTGDQDNYLEIALGSKSGSGVGVRIVHESSGTVVQDTLTPLSFLSAGSVQLMLVVDPAAGTVQPRISIDGGPEQNIGSPIALLGATLDFLRDPSKALAVGIMATSRGGTPYAATWDDIRVYPEGAGAAAVVTIDPPGSTIDGSTYNDGSFQIQNTSTGGQKITQVAFAIDTAMFPDMVFDPNGTAGDTLGRPFTPDGNAGAVGLQSHTFAWPLDGGFQTVAVVFNDFDPGENFAFAVDCDPTSINGAARPGPHESGSVSGLELSGSYVRVTFSDGTILESDTFRKGTTLDASTVTMRPATLGAPTVDVLGVSEPATVSSAGQTVRVGAPSGSSVRLVVIEGGLYLSGVPGGGHDIDPFEANTAISVQEYTGTAGAGGFVDIPITLHKTEAEGGISHIAAVIVGADGRNSRISNTSVVQLVDQALTPSPATVNFGSVVVGASSTQGVTLNAGSSSVQVTGATVTGAGFTLVSPPSFPTTIGAGGNLPLIVRFSPTSGGAYSGQLTVTHNGSGSPLVVPLSGSGLTSSGDVLYRVNVGGATLAAADSSAPAWSGDTATSPSPYLTGTTSIATNGSTIILDGSVPAAAPMAMFQSSRWDPPAAPEMHWAFPVASGTTVEVRLYLGEIWSGAASAGKRVFDVQVEGQLAFDDIDMGGSHGLFHGYMLAHQVTVQDGTLDLDFIHQVQNPQISGIEVVAVSGGGGNTPPVAVNDSASVPQGSSVVIPLLANDSDPDGTLVPSTTALASPPAHGSVSINPSTGAATYTHDGSSTTSDSFTYTVKDDDGATSNAALVSITVTPGVDPGATLYRVNAGGPTIGASGGDWSADTSAAPSSYSNVPGSGNNTASTTHTINMTSSTIPAGTPQAVFQTERWDPATGSELTYSFPVPAGQAVEVRLYMAEIAFTSVGKRIFDVTIDGSLVLNDYDVYAVTGGRWVGRVEKFQIVSDGSVDVQLVHVKENPSIKGVEVVSLEDAPEDGGVATLGVTPDGPIGAGSGNARAFRLTNNSTNGEKIVRARVSLPGSILPDMIFDPFGGAGDFQALAFRVDTDSGVGIGSPQYLQLHNGVDGTEGYDALELTFTDFDPGETLEFSIDVDPLSIHGHPGPSPAGAVCGLELSGATLEVEFDSGLTHSAELTPIPGVPGGASASAKDGRPAAPSITLDTIGAGPAVVLSPSQTVRVTGQPGASVRVFVVEAHLRPDGVPGGAYDLDPFEANTAVVVSEQDITLDGTGHGAANVTLTRTASPEGDIGLNHIAAVVAGAGGVSDLSNVVVAELREFGTGAVTLYRINAGGPAIPSPDGIERGWDEDQAVSSGSAGGPANPGTPSPYVNASQTDKTFGTNSTIAYGPSVPPSTPMQLFKTERWDAAGGSEMLWSFPVTPGAQLEVHLYLSEIYNGITAPGQRVFDVLIEGQLAMDNVDKFAESGGQKKAYVRSFTVTAQDNLLQVQLVHGVENPSICGIEVVQLASSAGASPASGPDAQGSVVITDDGVNQAPTAAGDTSHFTPGGSVVVNVLANDTDPEGALNPSSVTVVTPPAYGEVSVNASTGAVTYTSTDEEATLDSFAYTVADALGAVSGVATVHLTANPGPIAQDDAATVIEFDSVTIDVLANDTDDAELDPRSVTIVDEPSFGSASVDPSTGAITYAHDGTPVQNDTLTYTVRDSDGRESEPASVAIAIRPVDDGVLIEEGLVLRLESDDGLARNEMGVTHWTDLSPTGAEVLVMGGPQVLPGAVGGHDAIALDGVDDALGTVSGVNAMPLADSDRSVFLVARYHSPGAGFAHGQAPANCPGDDTTGFSMGVDDDGTLVAGGSCPDVALDSGVLGIDDAWMTQGAVFQGGTLVHYRDGEVIDAGAVTIATSAGPAVIGRSLDGERGTRMDVAAVLVYDRALTEPQRLSVEKYLRKKYLNRTPTAGEDVAEVDRGAKVTIDVLANDVDDDGALDRTSVEVVVPPSYGSAEVDPDTGVITYTHDGSPTTSDELAYTVVDDLGAQSDPTMVVVSVQNPCPADLAPPFGTLDVSDMLRFLELFASADPAADLADPPGVFTIDDVLLFLQHYAGGCE
ncbi:MAG: malectin domain-containing carbohydrate-binding protein [Phycisphaerales bacterium]